VSSDVAGEILPNWNLTLIEKAIIDPIENYDGRSDCPD